jgi:hypothetical protein
MKTRYPWAQLAPGKGFFVPGLDLLETRKAGLVAAVGQKVRIKARLGTKNGLLGVWFYLD